MTQEQINNWITEAHQIAVDHHFYDCPKCNGEGRFHDRRDNDPRYDNTCSICHGTGIDPNRNIGELLMLIVSELGEALEAHRCGRFAEKEFHLMNGETVDCTGLRSFDFADKVKDTFEDEIADVFIRLFDFCGYLRIEPVRGIKQQGFLSEDQLSNFGNSLSILSRSILAFPFARDRSVWAKEQINNLLSICQYHNISIEKHIKVKMAYNRIRPAKHGKEY